MFNSPYLPRPRARTFSTDTSACFKSSRTCSRKSFPSAVSVTPRELRRSRLTPISSSKSWICRLNAGCATRRRAAALVKFDASPTARKYRKCRSSTVRLYHAQKAWQYNKHGIGRRQDAHPPSSRPNNERKTMKNSVIDIVQRFQTHHALQEERELKNSRASRNGAASPSAPSKNGIPENTIFESEEIRISTVTLLGGTEWPAPHDGRERLVVRLGEMGHPLLKERDPAFPARWTWIP